MVLTDKPKFEGYVTDSDELIKEMQELDDCTDIKVELYSVSSFINWNDNWNAIVSFKERKLLKDGGSYIYDGLLKNVFDWIELVKQEDSKYPNTNDFIKYNDSLQVYKNINDNNGRYKPHDGAEIDDQGYYPVNDWFIMKCVRQMDKDRGGGFHLFAPPKLYIKHKTTGKYSDIDVDQFC